MSDEKINIQIHINKLVKVCGNKRKPIIQMRTRCRRFRWRFTVAFLSAVE
jgi:hypothetical protein